MVIPGGEEKLLSTTLGSDYSRGRLFEEIGYKLKLLLVILENTTVLFLSRCNQYRIPSEGSLMTYHKHFTIHELTMLKFVFRIKFATI